MCLFFKYKEFETEPVGASTVTFHLKDQKPSVCLDGFYEIQPLLS